MKNPRLLYAIGRPFSPFYSLAMRFREYLYQKGLLRVTRFEVPVISVGNLTMGGSGKTPVVQYIARYLQNNDWRPAVVSRGYSGLAREKVNLVSDSRKVLMDAVYAGDEPRLLADTLPGIPVLTGKVRKYPAERAVELGSDILVLDDGFQHMAVWRDLDLVLFNADFLAGNSRVFPGGDLREPVKALNRCHGFIITGVCQRNRDRAERFTDLLGKHFPDHPVFLAGYEAESVIRCSSDGEIEEMPLEVLKDNTYFGFSGIAHPRNFEATLSELGVVLTGFKPFPDHHLYTKDDLQGIIQQAKREGATGCITTEKDLVKLSAIKDSSFPLYALRMGVIFNNDFNTFLLNILTNAGNT